MATFTAIKGRGKGSGAMGGVMQYVQQKKKTLWEGQQLVTGYNCTSRTAYTTPDGLKCRDGRLHDEKYLKEVMEREFRIRTEIILVGIEATEHEAGTASPGSASNTGGLGRVDGEAVGNFPEDGAVEQQILSEPNTEAEQRDVGYSLGDEPEAGTGWEKERAALLASQVLYAENRMAAGGRGSNDTGRVIHDLVVLAKRVEDMQQPEPVSIPSGHIDKKRWKELQRKRLAAGHNPDDHVDEPVWQQKM